MHGRFRLAPPPIPSPGWYLSSGSTQHSCPFQPVPSLFSCFSPLSPAFHSPLLYCFHSPLWPFKPCTSFVPSLCLPLLLVRCGSSPYSPVFFAPCRHCHQSPSTAPRPPNPFHTSPPPPPCLSLPSGGGQCALREITFHLRR